MPSQACQGRKLGQRPCLNAFTSKNGGSLPARAPISDTPACDAATAPSFGNVPLMYSHELGYKHVCRRRVPHKLCCTGASKGLKMQAPCFHTARSQDC